MTRRRWTEEEINILQQCCKRHLSHKQMLLHLDRTLSAIKTKCTDLKLKNFASLEEIYPDIAKEWHPNKNNIMPDQISYGSGKIVWWMCKYKHEYRQSVCNKVSQKQGCPYCSGKRVCVGFNDLWTTHPELCKELMNKNDGFKYSMGCHKKINWICSIGHKWQMNPNDRTNDRGCPYCSKRKVLMGFNDLASQAPEICEEWDYEKNDFLPSEIAKMSNCKACFVCKNGHRYKMSISSRTSLNRGCPYCSGNKVLIGFNDIWTTHPELCKELVNNNDGYIYSKGSQIKIKWMCKKCNNIWKSATNTRIYQKQGCPKCRQSKGEKEIYNILKKYNIKYNQQKIFEKCKYKRCLQFDFYLPDYNLCIEYQREFHYNPHWSTNGKENLKLIKKRDQIKRDFCQKENIELLEIHYSDFDNIEQILKDSHII
jgi:hypothetical protein